MNKTLSIILGGAVLVGVGVPAVGAITSRLDKNTATVIRVIDGDTFEATVAGRATTIRLLNIDTPETKDPKEPVECLGPEATRYLEQRLPAGKKVRLEYDKERLDPYKRTLAGVFDGDRLVNADIAAEGLGEAVKFEPNHKFFDRVQKAQDEAKNNKRGFFDPGLACALPAQTDPALQQAQTYAQKDPLTAAEAETALARANGHLRSLDAALALVDRVRGMPDSVYARVFDDATQRREALQRERDRIAEDVTKLTSRRDQLKASEKAAADAAAKKKADDEARAQAAAAAKAEAEAKKAAEKKAQDEAREKAEAQRKAEAAEAKRAAEEAEAEAAERREEARQRAEERAAEEREEEASKSAASDEDGSSDSSSDESDEGDDEGSSSGGGSDDDDDDDSGSSGSYAGYTGPRCYAPGGKTWRPC